MMRWRRPPFSPSHPRAVSRFYCPRYLMAAVVSKVLTKVFGSRNDRLLKRYRKIVEQVNAKAADVEKMTDEQLRARTTELRAGLTEKKIRIADVMPEAMAIMRESMD